MRFTNEMKKQRRIYKNAYKITSRWSNAWRKNYLECQL